MPILAFLTCLFVGWFLKPEAIIEEARLDGNKFRGANYFRFLIKYICPIGVLLIIGMTIAQKMGMLTI